MFSQFHLHPKQTQPNINISIFMWLTHCHWRWIKEINWHQQMAIQQTHITNPWPPSRKWKKSIGSNGWQIDELKEWLTMAPMPPMSALHQGIVWSLKDRYTGASVGWERHERWGRFEKWERGKGSTWKTNKNNVNIQYLNRKEQE